MRNLDSAFFAKDQRGSVFIFHVHVENGAADRNHGSRRTYRIVVRHASEMLDLYLDFSKVYIHHVFPVARVGAKHHSRVWVDIESATVGHFKNRVAIGARY